MPSLITQITDALAAQAKKGIKSKGILLTYGQYEALKAEVMMPYHDHSFPDVDKILGLTIFSDKNQLIKLSDEN